jgi:hypothetical protein
MDLDVCCHADNDATCLASTDAAAPRCAAACCQPDQQTVALLPTAAPCGAPVQPEPEEGAQPQPSPVPRPGASKVVAVASHCPPELFTQDW